MNVKNHRILHSISILSAVTLALSAPTVFGQGRGNSGGAGRPDFAPGVGQGFGTASDQSVGRSDNGWNDASNHSEGRFDEGVSRARLARQNSTEAANEIREHPGIARHLGLEPSELQSRYQDALATNPKLSFGQFVSANVVSNNLGDRHPEVTTDALLASMAEGKSLGQSLRALGVSSSDAKDAVRAANREIREQKRQSKDS